MDDDEPPSGRECSSRLPGEGEMVRSVKEFVTYMGPLPAGLVGVVDKEINWNGNGGSHYWLKFDVGNVPLERAMPPGKFVKRYVQKSEFLDKFEVVRN